MADNISTTPCLICNANLNQKASFCHECGIAIDDQTIDTPSNIHQFNHLVRESFFDIEAWHDIEGLNQETFDFRKDIKVSYKTFQTIFDKFNNYRLKHKPLSDFQIEFDENVHDAYAGHDTHLTFKITNLSKSKRYKAYIFWDDRETDDEEDLHIKSVSFINMGKSAELGGTHVFTRVGPKTISDLIVIITDQLKNEARFKVEPFRFRVKNSTQQTINQISTKNQISIEGRGVVDASNMGREVSVSNEDLEPKWKKLDFHLLYTDEEKFSENLNAHESIDQSVDSQNNLANEKSFEETQQSNTAQLSETKLLNIYVPDLGKSDFIKIVRWNIPEGASFREYEVIADFETEKVTVEFTAPRSGTLEKIFVKPGEAVEQNQVIAQYTSSQDTNEINSEFKVSTTKKTHSKLDQVPSLKFPFKPVSLINDKDKDGWYTSYINNHKYRGQLTTDSFPTGYGLYYFHNGDIFEGTFETEPYGLRQGTYKFFNGDKFEGSFINSDNTYFEEGCYTWADGQSYTGTFINNQRAYIAEWKLIDGTIRQDTWAEDHPFWKSYDITLNNLFNENFPQNTSFKIIEFYNHSRLETKKRVKKNDPILLIEYQNTEYLIYSPIEGKFEIFNEYQDLPLEYKNAGDSIGEMHIELLDDITPPSILDYHYTTETITITDQIKRFAGKKAIDFAGELARKNNLIKKVPGHKKILDKTTNYLKKFVDKKTQNTTNPWNSERDIYSLELNQTSSNEDKNLVFDNPILQTINDLYGEDGYQHFDLSYYYLKKDTQDFHQLPEYLKIKSDQENIILNETELLLRENEVINHIFYLSSGDSQYIFFSNYAIWMYFDGASYFFNYDDLSIDLITLEGKALKIKDFEVIMNSSEQAELVINLFKSTKLNKT